MILKKYRWSRDYESNEEELTRFFESKNIETERWHAVEQQIFESQTNEYDTKLWCAEGSIIITIDGQRISLQPGDGLDLPAGTVHEAVAGISGCVCYEAQLPK
jgi:mannose-6-phosphate isomerase class I